MSNKPLAPAPLRTPITNNGNGNLTRPWESWFRELDSFKNSIPTMPTTFGTVTSAAMTVPTGLSVSGTPIITSGTFALSFASGYSIPLTTDTAKGVTAYNHKVVEDALNGLVKVDGAGTYSAITDDSTNWDTAYTLSHNRAHTLLSATDHTDIATYLNQALLTSSTPYFAGIGVGKTPTTKAHIYEDAASTVPQLLIEQDNAAGDSGIQFLQTGGQNYSMGLDITDGNFKINAGATLAASTHFSMTNTGQVGIGIATPGAGQLLHVYGNGVNTSMVVQDVTRSAYIMAWRGADTFNAGIYCQTTVTDFWLMGQLAGALGLGANSGFAAAHYNGAAYTPGFFITTTGKISFGGMTAPSANRTMTIRGTGGANAHIAFDTPGLILTADQRTAFNAAYTTECGRISNINNTTGGIQCSGYGQQAAATACGYWINGFVVNNPTGYGAIYLNGALQNVASLTTIGDTNILLNVTNNYNARFRILGNGDTLHPLDNIYSKWGGSNDCGICFSNITTWGGAAAGTQQNMQFWCQGVTATADFQFCDGDVLIGGTGGDNPVYKLTVITSSLTVAEITSTDGTATAGPNLNLYRNSDSPANNDNIGKVSFWANDGGATKEEFANIGIEISNIGHGVEESIINFRARTGGGAPTVYNYMDGRGLLSTNNGTIHCIAQTGAPTSTTQGALWLDTDAGGNGYLMCYANGGWRIVAML